ncbi:outer membrane protein assembly factor BamB family protein [Nocardiopsis nanhaiensis]
MQETVPEREQEDGVMTGPVTRVLTRVPRAVGEWSVRKVFLGVSALLAVVVLALVVHPLTQSSPDPDHTTAAPGTDRPVSDTVTGVGWVWDHPVEGTAEGNAEVVPVPTGVLVIDARGLYALDSTDGGERWRLRSESGLMSRGVSPDGSLVAVSFSERRWGDLGERLLALDTDTGEIRSDHFRSIGEDQVGGFVQSRELTRGTYVTESEANPYTVRAYGLDTRDQLWEGPQVEPCERPYAPDPDGGEGRPTSPDTELLATTEDRILAGQSCRYEDGVGESRLVAFDAENGEELWSHDSPEPVVGVDTASDGLVGIVHAHPGGDGESEVPAVALDLEDGSVLAEELPTSPEPRELRTYRPYDCPPEPAPEPGRPQVTAWNDRSSLVAEAGHGDEEIRFTLTSLDSGEQRTASVGTVRPFDAVAYSLGCTAVMGEGVAGVMSGDLAEERPGTQPAVPGAFVADWGTAGPHRVIDLGGTAEGFSAEGADALSLHAAPGAVVVSGEGAGAEPGRLRIVGLTPDGA